MSKLKNNISIPTTGQQRLASSSASTSGSKNVLSSKLLTMKFMRQAENKEEQVDGDDQGRQVAHESKWTLSPPSANANDKQKIITRNFDGNSYNNNNSFTIVSGVGFQDIDDADNATGRRSWGKFNSKLDNDRQKNETSTNVIDGSDSDSENSSDDEEQKQKNEALLQKQQEIRKRQEEKEERDIMRNLKSISGSRGGGEGIGGIKRSNSNNITSNSKSKKIKKNNR
ncbi:hypothetical protein V1514DRAFT_365410 [Lipomyces japonicus]|uniref:uncharacterized protein n=1 Tax=Lipomyces japonicus TaxID=56871 RepID=UPI0034CDF3B8